MSVLSMFGLSAASDRDPTSGFWYGPVGRRSLSGVTVNESTAMNYSAAWAGTRVLCATGASLTFNVFKRLGERKKELAEKSAAYRLLHQQPNPEMGAMMFRATLINHQVNWGGGFAEIVRELGRTGPVKELWPIHPSRIQPTRFDDGRLGYRVRNNDGSYDDFEVSEIFHVPSIISSDGICGKGVIQNARDSIGFGLAVEQQGAAFFANSARPSMVITGGNFKTKEDRAEYRRQWMEVHGGVEKSGTPALLPEGADIKFLSFSQEDSQFLETREHNINEMARWYGVPPHMLGDLRRATFSNIEAQSIEFVVYSLVPWLAIWEQEVWRKLFSPEEQENHYAKHIVNSLMRGDSAARSAFYKSMSEIGVFSINDIRELEDQDEIGPDGDKHLVPLNFTTIEKAGEEVPAPKVSAPRLPAPELEDEPEASIEPIVVSAALDTPAITSRCREVLTETVGRMLNKECRACKAAAESNKSPKAFYAWLDDYYTRYSETFADAIRAHVEIVMLVTADQRQSSDVVSAITTAHVKLSKESVLQATEVAASDWNTVPERIAACGARWQAERVLAL